MLKFHESECMKFFHFFSHFNCFIFLVACVCMTSSGLSVNKFGLFLVNKNKTK